METSCLTEIKIKKAIAFLKDRQEHARLTQNKEWVKEYENAVIVIKDLSTINV
ncbi:MAG: hypothetical protein JW760_02465 [Spirochaetales bacterium]|nr:hypothetical protein [Spirochaetales bacterium]